MAVAVVASALVLPTNIVERIAALDVHKVRVTVYVRVPSADGGREPHLAEFPRLVRGQSGLRDWLAALVSAKS